MRTIEIAGGVSRDHLVTVGEPPAYAQPGGPGIYASLGAVCAARLIDARHGTTTAVSLSATLPAGDTPERTLLTAAGIDVSLCDDGDIPLLWILNSPEGRRIVSTSSAGSHELDEAAGEATAETDRPLSGRADTVLRSAPMAPLTGDHRPACVLVDPDQRMLARDGWAYLEALAATTDVFLPSRVQLTQLGPDPRRAAQEIRSRTGRAVVARLDAEGSLVLPASGGAWRVYRDDVTVVDTTGAGDSHAGAVAAALTDPAGATALVNAAVVATAVVAHTLAGVGTQVIATIPTIDQHQLDRVRVQEEE